MSVGWERAAARLEREAQHRQDRRDRLRDGRRKSGWDRIEVTEAACARCGALSSDRFSTEGGEVCAGCFCDAEVAVASRAPSVGQRAALLAASVPGAALSGMLAAGLLDGERVGLRAMVGILLLSLFVMGWGVWSMSLGGVSLRADLARVGSSSSLAGWARVGLGLSTLSLGLLTTGAALLGLAKQLSS